VFNYPRVGETTLEKIIFISLSLYLFLLIFPHTTTLREVTFWTATLCWVILRIKKRESLIPLKLIILSLFVFMAIAFISSILGIEPIENLKRFKGELLVPFILFLVAATEFNKVDKAKLLFLAPLIAFATYTLLAIIESTRYGFYYFWDKTHREQYIWLTNYSQMAAVIFPLTLGLILVITNRWLKYFLISFAFLEFAILTAYRGFTVFIAAIAVVLLWVIFVKPVKYRLWMIGSIFLSLLMLGGIFYIQKDNPAMKEYKSKFKIILNIPEELKNKSGFSNRLSPWMAAVDVIKDRPLLGYGWGMKKYTRLVAQEKFLEKWKITKPAVYEFYIKFKGIFFPPHNVFLEIAIQSGLVGLIAFLIFIGIYILYLVKTAIAGSSIEIHYNFLIILIGGVLLSFLITGLMSNELGNMNGKIFFTVLGAGVDGKSCR